MTKANVYIAGKIGGLHPDDVETKFALARNEVAAMGHVPVCPRCLPHAHDKTWLSYMREDLTALLTCDALYAQCDWQDSPGATIEVNLAATLGIPIIYQQS